MGDSSMRVVSPQRHPALGRYISIYHDYHVVLHGLYLLVARTTNEWQHHSEPRRANVHIRRQSVVGFKISSTQVVPMVSHGARYSRYKAASSQSKQRAN